MMDTWAISLGSGLLAHAADAALRSIALALLASLVLIWARRKDAALRLVIWRVVLYSALAMPLMAWLLPTLALPLPVASSKHPERLRPQITFVQPARQFASSSPSPARVEILSQTSEPQIPERKIPRKIVATAFYVIVAGFLIARLAMGYLLGKRLQRRSRRIEDPELISTLTGLSARLGIRNAPELAESSAVAAPVTLGLRRSVILLPLTWRMWEQRKMRAVLAHEISHVARRDALTQTLAALHRSLFWFSPLGWWLERHLAQLAEEASDDFALNEISDRNYYAQILVDFLAAVTNARGRISWQGVSMAKGRRVERRVNRILSGSALALGRLGKPAWVAILLVAAPLACLMAAVRPVAQAPAPVAAEQAAPPPQVAVSPAPAAAPAPSASPLAASAQDSQKAIPPPPPAPAAVPEPAPAPAAAPMPPAPPRARARFQRTGTDKPAYWFSDDYQSSESFVIVSGDSMTTSGGPAAAAHAKSLESKIPGDFIWFRHEGKGYIIRDAATVRQAREFFAPQEKLGAEQAAMGEQQAELGRQQAELGRKMQQVRVKVPDMSADLKRLEEAFAKLREGATMEQFGEAQARLAELQARLGDLQAQSGAHQADIGNVQSELAQRQALLGQTQANLGAEQGRLARDANAKMKALLDNAIKSGKAQSE